MRRGLLWIMIALLLCGCTRDEENLKPALDLRRKLQSASSCSFECEITADYGDAFYTFVMQCTADKSGELKFEVVEPDTISGITGNISGDEGELTFDESVLAFDTLADGYITPVASPWVMVNALKSGYITSCGKYDGGYRIALNDTYEDDALQLDVWTDEFGNPIQCDILYKERRCLSLQVKGFTIV